MGYEEERMKRKTEGEEKVRKANYRVLVGRMDSVCGLMIEEFEVRERREGKICD